MPSFQFFLHTTGISHEVEGSDAPAIGFYAVRRAKGNDEDEAMEAMLEKFAADQKIAAVLQSGADAGLEPQTEIEEVHRLSWLETLIPWQHPGLIFYSEEDEEEVDEDEA